MRKNSQKGKYLIVLFLIMALVCFLSVKQGHQWGDDFAQYLQQAIALSEGTTEKFVIDNTYIVLNSPIEMATPVYPWGFPLLLSLFVPLFGTNIIMYKIICCTIITLMTVFFYLFLCNYFDEKKSFMLALCVGLDYYILKFCNNVVSDIPFLLIMLIIIVLMNDYFEKDLKWIKLLIIGLIMGYSYMVRSQGIVFILSYLLCNILYFILNKNKFDSRNIMSGLMPYIGFVVVFMLDKYLLPHSARSSLYFLESMDLKIFLENIWFYIFALHYCVSTPSKYQLFVYVAMLMIALLGVINVIKKKKDIKNILFLLLCTLMIYGINILFPWHQGGRYMIPAIPLFVLLIGYGIDFIFEIIKMNERIVNGLKICACIMFCIYGFVFYGMRNVMNGRYYGKGNYTPEALEVYEYINENVNKDEIICFFKPRALYFHTGIVSVKPLDNTYEAIRDCNYLLLCDEDDYIDLDQIKRSENGYSISLDKVFENERLTMYRINRNG